MNAFQEVYAIYSQLFKTELVALLLSLPRFYAFLATSQFLTRTAVPALSRAACILSLSLISIPINIAYAKQFDGSISIFALIFVKEYALGFIMGYLVGWVFWSVQAAGAFIDNQRGAAIAASIDPMQGHEASPLGILFSHAFITYVFVTGAMLPVIGFIYKSFILWPVDQFYPTISADFPAFMLSVMDNASKFVVLLAGPVVAVMFLAEFALALISRFAPQMQVFILAMPIKSILAIFMLIFYFATLLRYSEVNLYTADGYINYLRQIMPPK